MNQENQQETQQYTNDTAQSTEQVPQEKVQQTGATQPSTPAANEPLEQRIAELESLASQYKDQLLRKAAEFENYKKRTENDFLERVKYANEGLLGELLPVADDLERSLKSGKEKKDFDTLLKGIELINQKFLKALERYGVAPYVSLGEPFDPHLHDALMQVQRTDVPPHTVVDEVEKGYKMHGKVVRHAKVIVTADYSAESSGEATPNETASNGQ